MLPRTSPKPLSPFLLILAAVVYAAAELAAALMPGRFFGWGRAEALLFLAYRPWLLLLSATLMARFAIRSRLSFYASGLLLATLSEALLLLGLGASNPWPQLLRGLIAAAALLLVVELVLQLFRKVFGRAGPAAAALALVILFLSPIGLRGYENIVFAGQERRVATERPDLMLMTALPIIWGEKGAFDPESRPAAAYNALQREFAVRPLDYLDERTLGSGRLLLLAQPRALAPSELAALDQWVRSGGQVLILTDPWLAWPTELPLGDIRKPPPVGLLGPLLGHWGLTLEPLESRRIAIHDRSDGESVRRLIMAAPGRFVVKGPECRVGEDQYLARCRIGEGEAILLADADLLRDDLWTAPGEGGDLRHSRISDNVRLVAHLLDELAGIERERVGGNVEWVSADTNRTPSILLALLPLLAGMAAALMARRKRAA